MKFLKETIFTASPEQVFTVLTQEPFRHDLARAADMHRWEISVEESTNGILVANTVWYRSTSDRLPAAAQKVVGSEVAIHQVETWTSPNGGTIEMHMPGKPGHIKGDFVLDYDGTNTTQTVDADISVRIPLLGKTLEKLLAGEFSDTLDIQARLGNERLG
ncbi:MAG TPA: DUF2505 domain-containing protein [Marmoricola sp.]|nr:DUF2505 domain-containing protein [Marmoricola sp.]HNN49242.1 DUF2505 domain-containing protein [Marmoricola sp.]